jgi:hypothetical protein
MKRSRKSPESAPAENAVQAPSDASVKSPEEPAQTAGEGAADRLVKEIAGLREGLSRKMAELRALQGQTGGESDVVLRVVELLSRPEGATKAQLVEQAGAKKGYVDALLNRILPERGYTITGATVSGERTKTYRIP